MMNRQRFILLLFFLLVIVGCNSALTPEDIAATVDSQVGTAVAQTAIVAAPTTTTSTPFPILSVTPSPPHPAMSSSHTPSPQSSATPLPTTTRPPQRYLSNIRTTHTVTVDLATNLQWLVQSPTFEDTAWTEELADYASLLHSNATSLAQLNPPPARREFHNRVTAATTTCDQIAATLVQSAETADSTLFEATQSQFESCLQELLDIQTFLDNVGGGQANHDNQNGATTSWFQPQGCTGTTTDLIPLTDLGTGTYEGMQGGLYPGGSNTRPADHEAAGLALAATIQPLNPMGEPDGENGRIVLLSIGMSNTTGEFREFVELANSHPDKNPQLLVVNGAQPGGVARRMVSDDYNYWSRVDNSIADAGTTAEQVQVIWLKEADPAHDETFLEHAQRLQGELKTLVQLLKARFPNLKLLYLSSRVYGGYANTRLNPEPYAYQTGFAVKWLIEAQINGDPELNFDPANGEVKAPWLSWGPYLWADGLAPRGDGLTWMCSDFLNDGTHPAPGAREKVADLLWEFFASDSTTQSWFLR